MRVESSIRMNTTLPVSVQLPHDDEAQASGTHHSVLFPASPTDWTMGCVGATVGTGPTELVLVGAGTSKDLVL